MIDKKSSKMIGIYSSIGTFLILSFVLITFLLASGQKKWWLSFFQVRILFIPIVFYLIILSIGIGIIVSILVSIDRKHMMDPISEKVRLLANGDLENKNLALPLPEDATKNALLTIDQDLKVIQKKMKDMSTELQLMNARPQYIDGQTKEEILESERHRLARELHDSVSQQLFAAMMMLAAVNEQVSKSDTSEVQKKQLAVITEVINTAQSEMRALLLHLRPVNLEGKSLRQGIEQLLKELQTKINISMKWEMEDLQLPSTIENELFRIVQELLSNTLRHAKAKELEVYLHLINRNVLLRVMDDGVGFDTTKEQKAGSYGLMNIRERVSAMGGTIKIISFKNQGTNIEIKIPFVKEEEKDDQSVVGR